jgi:hypothetical protein
LNEKKFFFFFFFKFGKKKKKIFFRKVSFEIIKNQKVENFI